jgi:hypothetical protein
MVRIPDQPAAVRVYTDDEESEAARYASEVGGVVVGLPLSPPAGYTAGLSGSLIPHALSEADRSPGLKSDRGQGPAGSPLPASKVACAAPSVSMSCPRLPTGTYFLNGHTQRRQHARVVAKSTQKPTPLTIPTRWSMSYSTSVSAPIRTAIHLAVGIEWRAVHRVIAGSAVPGGVASAAVGRDTRRGRPGLDWGRGGARTYGNGWEPS